MSWSTGTMPNVGEERQRINHARQKEYKRRQLVLARLAEYERRQNLTSRRQNLTARRQGAYLGGYVPPNYDNPCQMCGIRFCSQECDASYNHIQHECQQRYMTLEENTESDSGSESVYYSDEESYNSRHETCLGKVHDFSNGRVPKGCQSIELEEKEGIVIEEFEEVVQLPPHRLLSDSCPHVLELIE